MDLLSVTGVLARLAEIEAEINANGGGRVTVNSLKVVTKAYTEKIKEAEENKRKSYRCICWIRTPGAGVTAEELHAKIDSATAGGEPGKAVSSAAP